MYFAFSTLRGIPHILKIQENICEGNYRRLSTLLLQSPILVQLPCSLNNSGWLGVAMDCGLRSLTHNTLLGEFGGRRHIASKWRLLSSSAYPPRFLVSGTMSTKMHLIVIENHPKITSGDKWQSSMYAGLRGNGLSREPFHFQACQPGLISKQQ